MRPPSQLDLRQLLADREAGLSCLQIAKKLGTTKGRIAGFLWRHDPANRDRYLTRARERRRANGILPRPSKAEDEVLRPPAPPAPPAVPAPILRDEPFEEAGHIGRPWNPNTDPRPAWLRRPSQRGR
jgi:hypothetical protein